MKKEDQKQDRKNSTPTTRGCDLDRNRRDDPRYARAAPHFELQSRAALASRALARR